MDYRDIIELILDENDFTVGGGSSSAIAGAFGCGLMGMVINLSKGKDYGYSDEKYDELLKELKELKAKFLQGAVDDNEAYMLIVNAYKLPKSTEEEKITRKAAIQNAGIRAAEVPMSNATLNKKLLEIGEGLLKNSNPACGTDLNAGMEFAKMGIKAGKENVEVNLPLIKDEKIVGKFKKDLENL
ncbi:MAG: cyclodeaminase/cyclohydrolase family protein [Peptoniphilus sp.]|uniref:cyclodeaminase/cyclohydrolase family protein n=1 Tax=Peptoniphilus sp. TaxID=1971214 RepID=UPI002A7525EC|nr:cyclodeaminase/cyclohydrolase family protein [Peptoniphilus sp.]MDY2987754.1 cyclodeaminase/cyclohydrolase family protein [Peptoniphilus sp.]